ncbi:MAG: N-acetyl sugar amidotransferase [Bacteroidota bacterium]
MEYCTRCVMDSTDPLMRLDQEGVCQYCKIHDEMEAKYPLDAIGKIEFDKIIEQIKKSGKGKKYDCIIGVSGGTDSTYQLHLAKKLGLRVLAVHFDNGWNSDIAVSNIKKATDALEYDLMTYVVDWEEFKDLQIAFLKASTPDSEIPTDLAIQSTLYRIAAEEGIKFIMNGHSFRTEGKVPIMWSYGDGKYLKAVHRIFGNRKLKTFPNYTIWNLFYYTYVKRIKQVRLLYYVPYNKPEIKKLITEKYGWVDYGGHHYESVYTRFYQGYILPRKFGIDKRKREYSALVRSGQMTRDEAFDKLKNEAPMPPELAASDKEYVIKKLGLTTEEFEDIMRLPEKTFLDYPNYYSIIRKFRKPIRWLYRMVSPTTPLLLTEMNVNNES